MRWRTCQAGKLCVSRQIIELSATFFPQSNSVWIIGHLERAQGEFP